MVLALDLTDQELSPRAWKRLWEGSLVVYWLSRKHWGFLERKKPVKGLKHEQARNVQTVVAVVSVARVIFCVDEDTRTQPAEHSVVAAAVVEVADPGANIDVPKEVEDGVAYEDIDTIAGGSGLDTGISVVPLEGGNMSGNLTAVSFPGAWESRACRVSVEHLESTSAHTAC